MLSQGKQGYESNVFRGKVAMGEITNRQWYEKWSSTMTHLTTRATALSACDVPDEYIQVLHCIFSPVIGTSGKITFP